MKRIKKERGTMRMFKTKGLDKRAVFADGTEYGLAMELTQGELYVFEPGNDFGGRPIGVAMREHGEIVDIKDLPREPASYRERKT